MKLSVIIPAYNELDTIEESIARVKRVGLDAEIIVVDDCSTDGTRELLQRIPDIRLVLHDRNMGKGMAIRTALQHATGGVVIIQDADLEYEPDDFPAMVQPIIEGKADVVYGSRFLKSKPKMRLTNYIANRILALAASVLFGQRITDEATCYKAFRAGLIKGMKLTCRRFEFCPEVTAKVLRRGIRIVEVPIRYTARTAAMGKKINAWDGVIALWTLIKFRLAKDDWTRRGVHGSIAPGNMQSVKDEYSKVAKLRFPAHPQDSELEDIWADIELFHDCVTACAEQFIANQVPDISRLHSGQEIRSRLDGFISANSHPARADAVASAREYIAYMDLLRPLITAVREGTVKNSLR